MHSLARCHTAVDSWHTNGQQAERRGWIETGVEKRHGEMFQLKRKKRIVLTVCLSAAGSRDGAGWLTI